MDITTDRSTILELIEAFRSSPCLWDVSNPDYKNRDVRKDAWNSLSEAFQIPAHRLEKKVTNLRSQFRREYKKLNSRQMNGSNRKCLWFAYEPLQFLAQEFDSNETRDVHVKQEATEDSSHSQFLMSEESVEFEETCRIPHSPKPTASKKRRLDYSTFNSINHRNDEEEEFDAFGRLVSISLKKLPLPQALSAQTELLSVLAKHRLSAFEQEHGQ